MLIWERNKDETESISWLTNKDKTINNTFSRIRYTYGRVFIARCVRKNELFHLYLEGRHERLIAQQLDSVTIDIAELEAESIIDNYLSEFY